MKIIDFRFRPNTPEILAGIANSSMFKGLCNAIDFSRMKGQTLEEVVAELDKHNVVKAVITGRDSETTYGAKANNDSVFEFITKFPEKFIGFMGMDPHKGMRGIASLKNAVEEYGIKGVNIDPYLAQIYVNDARYYPIYAKCCELDMPVIITTGPASLVPNAVIDHVAPRYIDFVARDFPELKIIVSHGGYPWVNEMITVAQRNLNVYLELSEYEAFPMAEAYVQAINTIIGDKVMFASAHPFVDFRDALEKYARLPIRNEVRENVMYKTAAGVLNLDNTSTCCPASANDEEFKNTQIESIVVHVIQELTKKGMMVGDL